MRTRFIGLALIALAACLAGSEAAAQPPQVPDPRPENAPQITGLTKAADPAGDSAGRPEYQLGDTVVVALDQPTGSEEGLVYRLLLNDVAVASVEPKATTQELRFRLQRAATPDATWKSVLGSAFPVGRRTLNLAVEWTSRKAPAPHRLAVKPGSLGEGGTVSLVLVLFEVECVVQAPGKDCSTPATTNSPFHLGDEVVVRIRTGETIDPTAWQLFLNDRAVTEPKSAARTGDGKGLRFQLVRSEGTRAAWTALMSSSDADQLSPGLSLGRTDQTEEKRATGPGPWDTIPFRLGTHAAQHLAIGVTVALVVAMGLLAVLTGMLRDNTLPGSPRKQQPLSLNRMQLLAWLLAIAGSYAYLAIYLDDINVLSAQALALLGISAATSTGSRIADDMSADKRAQTVRDAADTSLPEATQDAARTALEGYRTRKWTQDLFWENDAPSLHRLQMAGFTVMLLAIWVVRVAREQVMPDDISNNLITLMGLSGGTYVAVKAATPK